MISTVMLDAGLVLFAIAIVVVATEPRRRRRPPRVVRGVIARQTAARSTEPRTVYQEMLADGRMSLADYAEIGRVHSDRTADWAEQRAAEAAAAGHVDPPEPVTVTKRYAKDLFGRDGADESWAVALHNAPEGQLLPAGTPDVTIDDIDDRDVDDARWQQIWRDFDDRREAERYVSHEEWATRYPEMRRVFAVRDRAEIEAHEAHLAAVATIMTGPIDLPASPPMPRMTPAQARRNRKRTNRGLVTV